jgi:CAAX prenyl protease-like protein
MSFLCQQLGRWAEYPRLAPMAVFCALTALQGRLGHGSEYWVYLVKTLVGAWMVWEVRPCVPELRWKVSWEAVAAGVGVFLLWVGLDGRYPRLANLPGGWDPLGHFGRGSWLGWLFVGTRLAGSSLVVPPIEEVFYRSFVYRALVARRFELVAFNQFRLLPLLATAGLFGLAHPDRWLAALLCGLAYQGLVLRKNRLGDAMTAHGITNALLGLWIVATGRWHYW